MLTFRITGKGFTVLLLKLMLVLILAEAEAKEVSEPQEEESENTDNSDKSNVKTEANSKQSSENKTEKPKFQFLHDVAMFHSSGLQKLRERRALMSNIGPFRRALCARRDLEMRRQLCKVDKVCWYRNVWHIFVRLNL